MANAIEIMQQSFHADNNEMQEEETNTYMEGLHWLSKESGQELQRYQKPTH